MERQQHSTPRSTRSGTRLATVGLDLDHIAKLTYFVTDVTSRDVANQRFIAAFQVPRPARSFVGVTALSYGCVVEIEATACLQAVQAPVGC